MKIEPEKKFIESHLQWRLHPGITVEQIEEALPGISDQGLSADAKVHHHWAFLADDQECSIWDYRDMPWSAYGPPEVFEALGLEVIGGIEDYAKAVTLLNEVRA